MDSCAGPERGGQAESKGGNLVLAMMANAQNVRAGGPRRPHLLNETGGFGTAGLLKGFLAWEA